MSLSLSSLYAQDTETYNQEYVAQDMLVTINGESSMTFQGSVGNTWLDFTVFGSGYGMHEIEGYIDKDKAIGSAEYSYSEELKSDLLVAIMDVPSKNWKVKVTMYSLYIEPTDTIVCENVKKSTKKQGWFYTLTLSCTHEKYGDVSFSVQGCDGKSYGQYSSISGKIDGANYYGKGTWKNNGESEVLDAILANDDTTKVFHVMAYTKTPAKKPIDMVVSNAIFEESENNLAINGTSTDGKTIALELVGFSEIGYGNYDLLALSGKINDIDVANTKESATLSIAEEVITLTAQVEDTQNNIYALSITGTFPTTQNFDVTAINMTATPSFGTDLLLAATTEDGVAIELILCDGVNTQYGYYGYDEYGALIVNAKYGNTSLTLSKDIAAHYYQMGDIDIFEGQFVDSEDNLYIFKLYSAELPSSVGNITTTTVLKKIIDNGQLIIIRNGVKYNVQGTTIQ